MKKILLVVAGIAVSLYTQAQITLNYSNAPSVAQSQVPDTLTRLKLVGLPSLSAGTNMTWDLTTAGDSIDFHIPGGPVSNSVFPNASFQSDAYYAFSGLSYNISLMKNIASNGILIYGAHVDRQAISLLSFTGGANDSLIFPLQDVMYTAPEREVVYPTTMSDSWTDVIDYKTNFNLTVAAYSLNNTPGERRTQLTITNTVIGWGKMKVNDKDGNPTGSMDVLLVKSERVARDSFFLGGSPAPAPLMVAFGLTQGQLDKSYLYNFRRANEYVELVYVKFTDNTYTTIERCDVHQQRLAPTSVNTISKVQINIYPNPATNGSFTVKVDGVHKGISYQLYNMTGQAVTTGTLSANGTVSLPSSVPAGNYFIKLQTEEGAYGMKKINIIR